MRRNVSERYEAKVKPEQLTDGAADYEVLPGGVDSTKE